MFDFLDLRNVFDWNEFTFVLNIAGLKLTP